MEGVRKGRCGGGEEGVEGVRKGRWLNQQWS